MEPPISFDADAVRAKKTELFEAIRPVSLEDAVRGQYGSGDVLGKKVRDYRNEPDVAADSRTETYVALKLGIDNWRWAGVPFYLRTGKSLSTRTTEIAVQFRQAPYSLFRDTPVERLPPNILTLRIQPDEGLSISFSAKRPGSEIEIDGVEMDFAYRDYFAPFAAVGYETLIYDCLIGDATLFQRADTVEAAWRPVQGLLDSWARDPASEFPNYAAGTAGPGAANRLIARDARAGVDSSQKPPEASQRSICSKRSSPQNGSPSTMTNGEPNTPAAIAASTSRFNSSLSTTSSIAARAALRSRPFPAATSAAVSGSPMSLSPRK